MNTDSKFCGDCLHFQVYRDPDTGRAHASKPGRCGWPKPKTWSMAYRRKGYGWEENDPEFQPAPVWKITDAKTCQCYLEKGQR